MASSGWGQGSGPAGPPWASESAMALPATLLDTLVRQQGLDFTHILTWLWQQGLDFIHILTWCRQVGDPACPRVPGSCGHWTLDLDLGLTACGIQASAPLGLWTSELLGSRPPLPDKVFRASSRCFWSLKSPAQGSPSLRGVRPQQGVLLAADSLTRIKSKRGRCPLAGVSCPHHARPHNSNKAPSQPAEHSPQYE